MGLPVARLTARRPRSGPAMRSPFLEFSTTERLVVGHAAVAGAAGAENQPSPMKKRRLAKQSAVVAAGGKGASKQPRATLGVYVERKQGFTEGNRFITEQDL